MTPEDEALVAQFRAGALAPEDFDHRTHLRVAWLYLNRYPLPQACVRMCADTRAFAGALGAPGKYHHTITEALMRIAATRLRDGEGRPFVSCDAFLAANPALLADARSLLARHYSAALLDSDAARQHWVAPDREPIEVPVDAEPVDLEPVDLEPVGLEPVDLEPRC